MIIFARQMGLPMKRPYEGEDGNNPFQGKIPAGQSRTAIFRKTTPFATPEETDRGMAGDHPLYVMGWISYIDALGTIRRTAFCRKWNHGKRRFVREDDDPDYEHEE